MRSAPIFLAFFYSSCAFSEVLQQQRDALVGSGKGAVGVYKQAPGAYGELNYLRNFSVEELSSRGREETEIPVQGGDFEPNRKNIQKHTGIKPDTRPGGLPGEACSEAARLFANKSPPARARFIKECLTDAIPDDKALLNAFVKNLVYLSNADPESPSTCTGLLLSRTRVLTAAHCRPRKVYLSDGSVRNVERNDTCSRYVSQYCDHAFLTILPALFDPVPVLMAEPVQHNRLWIPGYAIEDIYKDPDDTDRAKLKWENFGHGSCKVEYTREGCFANMCQVMSGYSGAPVVDVDKSIATKEIAVIGMHVTSSIKGTSCSLDIPDSKMNMNFGIPVNSMPIGEGGYAKAIRLGAGGVNGRGLQVDPQPIPHNRIRTLDNR